MDRNQQERQVRSAFGLVLCAALGFGAGQWWTESRMVAEPTLKERQEAAYNVCFAEEAHSSLLRLDELAHDRRMTGADPTNELAAIEEKCGSIYREADDCDEDCRRVKWRFDLLD